MLFRSIGTRFAPLAVIGGVWIPPRRRAIAGGWRDEARWKPLVLWLAMRLALEVGRLTVMRRLVEGGGAGRARERVEVDGFERIVRRKRA